MDDVRPAVRDGDRRSMTYAEIAAVRGISAQSAERLVRRRRWPKQLGNDGTVRVLVPADEAQPASVRSPGGRQAGRPSADVIPAIRETIREVIQPLTEQLQAANRRADAERERAEAERARADRAERRGEVLQAALDAKSRELTAIKLTEPTSPPAAALLVQAADREEIIDDLRRRLDEKRARLTAAQVETAEVRGRLAALETERTKPVPAVGKRRSWWPWRRG